MIIYTDSSGKCYFFLSKKNNRLALIWLVKFCLSASFVVILNFFNYYYGLLLRRHRHKLIVNFIEIIQINTDTVLVQFFENFNALMNEILINTGFEQEQIDKNRKALLKDVNKDILHFTLIETRT